MKIRVSRSALDHALGIVSACLATKALRPVLQNFKLSAAGTDLEVMATDLEMSVRHRIDEAEILEPGEVLLPGRQLMDIVREGRSEKALEIEVADSQCTITGQFAHYELSSEDVADFPELPDRKEGGVKIPAGDLAEMVRQTAFAVAADNPRAALTGVFVKLETGGVEMVATDGRRLALSKRPIDGGPEEPQEMIVPCKTLREVERAIGEDEQTVRLVTDEHRNQAIFQTERTLIASVLIDAQFPNYKDVLPKGLDSKVELNGKKLESAVRQASIMASEDTRAVELAFGENDLTIRSRAPERGEAEVKMQGLEFQGEPLTISFNPDYLLDVLKVTAVEEEDTVTLQFKDPSTAAQVNKGRQFVYVIMPIKPA